MPLRTIEEFSITIDADLDPLEVQRLLKHSDDRLGVRFEHGDQTGGIDTLAQAFVAKYGRASKTYVWKAKEGDYLPSEGTEHRLFDDF